jgi:hypothetical protein
MPAVVFPIPGTPTNRYACESFSRARASFRNRKALFCPMISEKETKLIFDALGKAPVHPSIPQGERTGAATNM